MKKVNFAVMMFENGHAPYLMDALLREERANVVAISVAPRYYEILNLKKYGDIPVYYSDREMLEAHPEIEACVCGGANHRHMEEFRMCAERGIHVISMKVPSLDMSEYDEMIRLSAEHKIVCSIELEMRWHAEVYRLKELIRSGALGKVQSFNAFNYSHFPMWWNTWMNDAEASYGKRVPLWPGSRRFRGGALTDHPHIFDLARFLFESDYECVYAEAAPSIREDAEVEDLLTIIGKLKNGVVISLDPSYANREKKLFKRISDDFSHYPRCVEVECSVFGDRACALVDLYGSALYAFQAKPELTYEVWGADPQFNDVRKLFLRNFIKQINGEKFEGDMAVSLDKYRPIMDVVNACYESISTGKVVYL